MNANCCFAPRNARRRSVSLFSILYLAALAILGGALCFVATSCSNGDAALTKIETAAKVVYQDATSTAGQQLLADVTSTALNVGLNIAAGNDVGAGIAGIQGAASAVRDYEGLPTAPSATTIAKVAAAGSGVTHVAVALAPSVEAIIENAQKSASTQKVNVTTDQIIEALARGFDAVAPAKGL